MSDEEESQAKRKRYGLREIKPNKVPVQTRYLLRSRARKGEIEVEPIKHDKSKPKRKRRLRIQKLMDLNHDCILEIFRHTDIKTLSNVAKTCERLNDLARYHFRVKHHRMNLVSLFEHGAIRNPTQVIRKLLQNFGDLITSLCVSGNVLTRSPNMSNNVILFIHKYCCSLKELIFEDFDLEENSINVFQMILKPIEFLSFDNCFLNGLEDLSHMNEIKSLKIHNTDCILHGNFIKLETLDLANLDFLPNRTLENFLNSNKTIKSFSAVECMELSSTVFGAIGQLKQLEELQFQQNRSRSETDFKNDLQHLTDLKMLKTIKLNCNGISVSQMLEEFVKKRIAIEHLELVNGQMDDATYKNISALKSIKILKMSKMIELAFHHVSGFGKELTQLEQLHLKTSVKITQYDIKRMLPYAERLSCLKIDTPNFAVDQNIYDEMLSIIQKREGSAKLEITIYGDDLQLSVPGQQNTKWFSVKALNRAHNHIFPHDRNLDLFDDTSDDDDDEFEFDEMGRFILLHNMIIERVPNRAFVGEDSESEVSTDTDEE